MKVAVPGRRFGRVVLFTSLCVALGAPGIALADDVVPDDQIVQGSQCVGVDCVNNENFGFDTLRLKENNLRIDFNDTSSTGSFPTNDWGIVVNDSNNGGANYFMIQDRGADGSASDSVFRIDAGSGGAMMMGFGAQSSGLNTVSFGASGSERRLTNVSTAVDGTDAVNLDQLHATAQSVTTSAAAYADAGDAATLSTAQSYADAGDAATLSAAQSYSNAQSTQTLSQANAYTDMRVQDITLDYSRFKDDVFQRIDRTNRHLNRSGAMSTAMAQMTASAAGGRTPNRVAVGVGFQGGQQAVSFGYQRNLGSRSTFTLGAAFSSGQSTAGFGVSTGW
ncbi:YadA-like family protein [Oleiagrimonas soli]|uniref:Trimeric autotransporter adhesin YadA-like stalk domain-containing protein n=1 Tax=Oleiagrimonas soli TaxID=1543381 RepID=A0A841KIQ4_9GAMM|nr:YadA-like family protein [Oleiagrimonas soli]MBB6183649.1 hypothetical protein [Oleiagrimonas soli]